ncbi:MAG TPA: sulfite exporter TauE/SafE family protein [Campylobacterales bacterium]|nr:sulfite exporter TauE/SafE family protein [Campylobacterales bacterium]
MENASLLAIAAAAFFGSLGHCVGMCGGFVLAYSSTKVAAHFGQKERLTSHLLYNFGRTISYTIIGAIAGLIGSVFALSPDLRASLYLFAGVVMLLVSLWLFGFVWVSKFLEYDFTKISFFKSAFQRLLKSDSRSSFLSLGVLNGFFPCGLVYFFASSAAASGSALKGAAIMFIFGLSTMLPMLTLAYASGILQKTDFRKAASKISAILILGFAVYTIWGAFVIFLDLPI